MYLANKIKLYALYFVVINLKPGNIYNIMRLDLALIIILYNIKHQTAQSHDHSVHTRPSSMDYSHTTYTCDTEWMVFCKCVSTDVLKLEINSHTTH